MEKFKSFLNRNIEFLKYTAFGLITTVINVGCYTIFNIILGHDLYLVSNIISWIFAVAFAFITNKLWVFDSKSWDRPTIIKEFGGFVGARMFSLILEEIGLFLMIEPLNMQAIEFTFLGIYINGELIAKAIMQVIVVLLNYIFSKMFIFKNDNIVE